MRAWKSTASAITVRKAISLDESTGSSRFQPDEDRRGVEEIVQEREVVAISESFAMHQVCRLKRMVPKRVPLDKVIAAVMRTHDAGERFSKDKLAALAAELTA
jgi:hypothetical protein